MSSKEKSNQNQNQGKKGNKKAQKAAKQEQKIKEGVLKVEKKEFTQLVGIEIKKKEDYSSDNYLIIKNKKAQQYATEILPKWQKQDVTIVGFAKQIPKAISVAQIFKREIGVYDQRQFKVLQKTTIKQDENREGIIQIFFSKK